MSELNERVFSSPRVRTARPSGQRRSGSSAAFDGCGPYRAQTAKAVRPTKDHCPPVEQRSAFVQALEKAAGKPVRQDKAALSDLIVTGGRRHARLQDRLIAAAARHGVKNARRVFRMTH